MHPHNHLKRGLALAVAVAAMLILAAPASAQTGGYVAPSDDGSTTTTDSYGPVRKAHLNSKGRAIPADGTPPAVVEAINAANRIRKKPYLWGGGHATWEDRGYDCSGAVSYVLHAAGLLDSPLSSGGLMRWGVAGRGTWIKVFANRRHTYAIIAGLRWDTSPMGYGKRGPRWRKTKRDSTGFKKRHANPY